MRPKHLAIELSKLDPHPCSSVELEQYATEGDLAAYWMLGVDQLDDVQGKHVVDLAAGNGILGLATLLIGASHVTLIEGDEEVLESARANIERVTQRRTGTACIVHAMIGQEEIQIEKPVDLVVMNPPWGVQTARADRPLLEYAFSLGASAVHILHSSKAMHVQALAKDYGYEGEIMLETEFRLPPTYAHHTKGKAATEVRCWRFHRPGDAKLIEDEIEEA
jgi:predicted RNA methylase